MSVEYGNGTLEWVSCVSDALDLNDHAHSCKGSFVDEKKPLFSPTRPRNRVAMCFVNCSFIWLLLIFSPAYRSNAKWGYVVLNVRRTSGRHEVDQATSPFSLTTHACNS